MVLWEIALATTYFLGLKRTFKLVLKTQRRLVSPEYPRIRQFLRGYFPILFNLNASEPLCSVHDFEIHYCICLHFLYLVKHNLVAMVMNFTFA